MLTPYRQPGRKAANPRVPAEPAQRLPLALFAWLAMVSVLLYGTVRLLLEVQGSIAHSLGLAVVMFAFGATVLAIPTGSRRPR